MLAEPSASEARPQPPPQWLLDQRDSANQGVRTAPIAEPGPLNPLPGLALPASTCQALHPPGLCSKGGAFHPGDLCVCQACYRPSPTVWETWLPFSLF